MPWKSYREVQLCKLYPCLRVTKIADQFKLNLAQFVRLYRRIWLIT